MTIFPLQVFVSILRFFFSFRLYTTEKYRTITHTTKQFECDACTCMCFRMNGGIVVCVQQPHTWRTSSAKEWEGKRKLEVYWSLYSLVRHDVAHHATPSKMLRDEIWLVEKKKQLHTYTNKPVWHCRCVRTCTRCSDTTVFECFYCILNLRGTYYNRNVLLFAFFISFAWGFFWSLLLITIELMSGQ